MLGRIDPITYSVCSTSEKEKLIGPFSGIWNLMFIQKDGSKWLTVTERTLLRAKQGYHHHHLHEEEIQQLSSCFVSSSRQNLLCSLIRRFDSVSAAVVRSLSPPSHLVSIRHPYRNSGSWFQTKYSLLTEPMKVCLRGRGVCLELCAFVGTC